MKKGCALIAILFVFFLSCRKERPVAKYDLQKITGTYTGQLKTHYYYPASSGAYFNGDTTSYTTSVTVQDKGDGHFSVTSGYFLWLDSTHVYYPFDTASIHLPTGIYFSRGGDTIYISGVSSGSIYPYYNETFVGVK